MTENRLIIILILLGQYCFGQTNTNRLPILTTIYNIDDSTQILSKSLPANGTIILILYDPGCSHCQTLGEGIAKQWEKLKESSVFFISMQEKAYVEGFVNMFAKGLREKKNISFWRDPGVEFFDKVKPTDYPATYIYDATTRMLLYSFQGESDIDKLLDYIPR